MTAEHFKETLDIIEHWQDGAGEEGYECRVEIYGDGHCHFCKAWDILDYCTGEGEWQEGDEVGFNDGKAICILDLDKISAIKVRAVYPKPENKIINEDKNIR